MQRQLAINMEPHLIGGGKSGNLSLELNLGTEDLLDSKSKARIDPEEHRLVIFFRGKKNS
jgi:hypothetical protein